MDSAALLAEMPRLRRYARALVSDETLPERLRRMAKRPPGGSAEVFQPAAVDRQKRPFLECWSVQRIAAGLAIAHVVYSPDVRRPVEITADQEDQLVKWLSKRLGTAVSPPRLGALGYELIGGRLLPSNSGPVAQFMYHDASGQRLTLYVSTENTVSHDAGFRFVREGPVNVFYWVDGKFGYALSAGIDKGELARVATAVYDQLDHK